MANSSAITDTDKLHILGRSSNHGNQELAQNSFLGDMRNLGEAGSFDMAEPASHIQPRYHFAPSTTVVSSYSSY